MRTTAWLSALGFGLWSLFSIPELSFAASNKTVTVISEAAAASRPDRAVFIFQFSAYGWTVEKAQAKVDKTIETFLAKLNEGGIRLSTSSVGEIQLQPSYQYNRDLKTSAPSDFVIARGVTIELEDLNQIGKLMEKSLSVGSFVIRSGKLTLHDKTELTQRAFEAAVKEGRIKAERMAKTIGSNLGEIESIEELGLELQEQSAIQNNFMDAGLSYNQGVSAEDGKTAQTHLIQARSRLKLVFSLQ